MKKTLKLLGVFLLLAAFTNCQKDDVQQAEARHFGPGLSPVKYLYGPDALKAKEKLRAAAVNKKINTKGLNGEKSDGWAIDFSEVLYVKDSAGTSYTYRLTHPRMAPNQFYNLVLTENADLTTRVLRVNYTMASAFYLDFASGKADITRYQGSIVFSPLSGSDSVLPLFQPLYNPQPSQPQPAPVNPCDDDTVVVIGGVGGAPNPGTGGSEPIDYGGNGSGRIPNESLELVSCFYWKKILCSENTPGHYGNDATCTASFKGAIVLMNRCTENKSLKAGHNKNNNNVPQIGNPCGDGPIGVLVPAFLLKYSLSLRNNFSCQVNIMQGVNAASSPLMDAFRSVFDNPDTAYDINYTNSTSLSNNVNASTIEFEPYIDANGTTTYIHRITFRDNFLDTATDLAIARVTIHENLHAILLYLMQNDVINITYANPTHNQLLEAYANKLVQLGQLPNDNNAHHTFMSHLTEDIAAALKAYGISKGYNLPDQFYNDMSWGGLTKIEGPNGFITNPVFSQLVTSNNARNRINDTIDAEATNQVFNGVSPKGIHCN